MRRNAVRETERTMRRFLWYTDGERYNDLFAHGVFNDELQPDEDGQPDDEDQDVEDLAEYDRYFDQLDETRTMTGSEMFALNNNGSWV